jgi:hypothetical protein
MLNNNMIPTYPVTVHIRKVTFWSNEKNKLKAK